jgi:hypothetical protein
MNIKKSLAVTMALSFGLIGNTATQGAVINFDDLPSVEFADVVIKVSIGVRLTTSISLHYQTQVTKKVLSQANMQPTTTLQLPRLPVAACLILTAHF